MSLASTPQPKTLGRNVPEVELTTELQTKINNPSAQIGAMAITQEKLSATARAQYGIFDETYEAGADSEGSWTYAGAGVRTYPTLAGVKGNRVLHVKGYSQPYTKIPAGAYPFDPNLLY